MLGQRFAARSIGYVRHNRWLITSHKWWWRRRRRQKLRASAGLGLGHGPHVHCNVPARLNRYLPNLGQYNFAIRTDKVVVALVNLKAQNVNVHESQLD
jgi:hypothetical protein